MKSEEKKVMNDLKAGKYRSFYLVYNRKSTDDLDNQKNSIAYQKTENVRFARKEFLPVAHITIPGFCADGIISEKHSGFKESGEMTFAEGGLVQYRIDRPKFYKLVQFLNEGYFKGFVVLCWDRVSRNKSDASIVRKLMGRGVDVRFLHASYDKTSAGELHMDIDGMFAEHHSRVTSEKVTLNIRNLREKGVCTYRAPVGYLNTGDMYHKPFDTVRAPIIKKMFELCATGEWSLIALARWANDQGLTMPPMRARRTEQEILAEETDITDKPVAFSRPLIFTVVHKILSNPFYTGKIIGNNNVYVPSISHKPLVSEDLFNLVQKQLSKKNVSAHYSVTLDHPYRGLVRCELCKRLYTPYPKKGTMYYSCRCKDGCLNENKTINIGFIETKSKALICNLTFTKDELAEIDSRTNTDIVLFEEKRIGVIECNNRRQKKLREDISYLRTNKLNLLKTGVFSPEDYLAEEERLNNELSSIQEEDHTSDVAMHEMMKTIVTVSELLKNVAVYCENAKPHEIELIIKSIFSELTIFGDTLRFKCRNSFKPFEDRILPMGDPIGWLSEMRKYYSIMQASIKELRDLLK